MSASLFPTRPQFAKRQVAILDFCLGRCIFCQGSSLFVINTKLPVSLLFIGGTPTKDTTVIGIQTHEETRFVEELDDLISQSLEERAGCNLPFDRPVRDCDQKFQPRNSMTEERKRRRQ